MKILLRCASIFNHMTDANVMKKVQIILESWIQTSGCSFLWSYSFPVLEHFAMIYSNLTHQVMSKNHVTIVWTCGRKIIYESWTNISWNINKTIFLTRSCQKRWWNWSRNRIVFIWGRQKNWKKHGTFRIN